MPSPEIFNDYFAGLGRQKHSLITEPLMQSMSDVSCLGATYPTDSVKFMKL